MPATIQEQVISSRGRTIAVVEDEPEMRRILVDALTQSGFVVREAADGHSLQQLLASEDVIDLITLDLNLAGEDGLAIARRVRAKHNIPIIMISSRVTPKDRVNGLESGADDYIIKPFHLREVIMRVSHVLERYALQAPRTADDPGGSELVEVDGCLVDFRHDRMHVGTAAETEMTNAEAQILNLLIMNPGRILSRDDINQALKGRKWSPMDRTIDSVVARLRKKIEAGGGKAASIKTVWGIGYTFVGEAVRRPAPD